MNTTLLDKCLDQILLKPERWDQSMWVSSRPISDVPPAMLDKIEEGATAVCGTTACLAGHALVLSGKYKTVITDVGKDNDLAETITDFEVDLVDVKTGEPFVESYPEVASELLGIDYALGRRLFHMTESLAPEHFVTWVRDQVEAWPNMVDINDDRYAHLFSDSFKTEWGIA